MTKRMAPLALSPSLCVSIPGSKAAKVVGRAGIRLTPSVYYYVVFGETEQFGFPGHGRSSSCQIVRTMLSKYYDDDVI